MFENINIQLFTQLNQFTGKNVFLDGLAIILAEYLPYVFLVFLIYLWFNKTIHKHIALYSGYAVLIGLGINFIIRTTYYHARPFVTNLGTQIIEHAPTSSFPSNHTTFMLSIAFMTLYFKETRKAGIIFSILGLIGGIARIYSGIHFPFDILGSIIVAVVSTGIIFILKEKIKPLNTRIALIYNKIIKKIN